MYFINEYDTFNINNKNIYLNYISGACDIVDNSTSKNIKDKQFDKLDKETLDLLTERRYIFNSKNEYDAYIENLNRYIDKQEVSQVPSFLLIPSYDCNLNCSYCFEKKYEIDENKNSMNGNELYSIWVDTVFKQIQFIVKREEKNIKDSRDIVITLMGGEPLMAKNKNVLMYIIDNIKKHNYSYNIITNGFDVDFMIETFMDYPPSSVQITIDGPEIIHDSRRITTEGAGTFKKIMSNVKKMVYECNLDIQLRINVDQSNIKYLTELSEYLKDEFGELLQTKIYAYIYPLQDGGCLGDIQIIDEISCIESVAEQLKKSKYVSSIGFEFHGESLINSIFKGTKYRMKTRICSATKNQYIFDVNNAVYKCWFGVGNERYKIGDLETINTSDTFKELDNRWKSRTTTSLKECIQCKYRYVCGGGCLSHILTDKNMELKNRCLNYYDIFEAQLRMYI